MQSRLSPKYFQNLDKKSIINITKINEAIDCTIKDKLIFRCRFNLNIYRAKIAFKTSNDEVNRLSLVQIIAFWTKKINRKNLNPLFCFDQRSTKPSVYRGGVKCI